MREIWLRRLLRLGGTVCLLALVPLVMPRSWIEHGHRLMGLGEFPAAPIAEYLARSVSALCAFYGGLLWVLSSNVRRHAPVIRYQALAIMLFSAFGIYAGIRAGLPAKWVIVDALACWAFLVPVLILARQLD